MTTSKKLSPRKLLVAAIGVATVNYVAAVACTPPTSGNLPSPRPETPDAASSSTPHDLVPTSGNLPAPVPRDAGPR